MSYHYNILIIRFYYRFDNIIIIIIIGKSQRVQKRIAYDVCGVFSPAARFRRQVRRRNIKIKSRHVTRVNAAKNSVAGRTMARAHDIYACVVGACVTRLYARVF